MLKFNIKSIDFNWVIFNRAEKKVVFVSSIHHLSLSEPYEKLFETVSNTCKTFVVVFYNIGPFIFRATGKVSCVDDNDDNLDLHNILFFSFCTRDKQNFIVKLIVIKLTSIILCFKNLLLNFDLFIIFFEMCFFIKAVWLPHMYFFCKKEIYSAIFFIWIFIWKKLFNKV